MNKTLILILILTASACVTHKELVNFNEGPEFPLRDSVGVVPALRIQPDDLLSIRVRALDMEAAEPFNLDPERSQNIAGGGAQRATFGYLVDNEGFIDVPVLGALKVEGLTTNELKDTITQKLQTYLTNPVVVVRFTNFRITMLGEVGRPGTLTMQNERVTILDAIGQAGDLGVYANRKDILVIREQDGVREFGHINLNSRTIFESPYFFLKQNDVIYVAPVKEKTVLVRDQTQKIAPWIAVISSILTLALTLKSL